LAPVYYLLDVTGDGRQPGAWYMSMNTGNFAWHACQLLQDKNVNHCRLEGK